MKLNLSSVVKIQKALLSFTLLATSSHAEVSRTKTLAEIEEFKSRSSELLNNLNESDYADAILERAELESLIRHNSKLIQDKKLPFELRLKAALAMGQICHNSDENSCTVHIERLNKNLTTKNEIILANISNRLAYPSSNEESIIPQTEKATIMARGKVKKQKSPFQKFLSYLGFER